MRFPKHVKYRRCQNPACFTNEKDLKDRFIFKGFYLSTAMDEKTFCSLSCEQEVFPDVRGVPKNSERRRKAHGS